MTTGRLQGGAKAGRHGASARVLVVAYHFPPEGSIGTHRTLRLVRQLVEGGWDVTVLTGTQKTYAAGYPIDLDLLSRVPPAVKVVRAPVLRPFQRVSALLKRAHKAAAATPAPQSDANGAPADSHESLSKRLRRAKQRLDGVMRIPDPHVGWLVPAVVVGLKTTLRELPDVVYSTSPPWTGQLVARVIATVLNCAWVADFRDPWARAPWREGRLPIAARAADVLEKGVIRRADAVVFTTRTNMDEYTAFYHHVTASKFHLVRNGCDRNEFEGIAPLPHEGRFTLLHAGSLYGGRKPTALFNALASLRDRRVIDARTFCFRQIGRVALGGFDMAAERTRLGLEGIVEMAPAQPRKEILREMVSASCLLLLQPGTTVSIPGKLFEYFAAGRPILAIAEPGETSELVRASGRGLAVLPDDQQAIERAIERLVTNTAALAPSTPLALFDGELRTRELVAVLESMIRRRTPVHDTYRASARSTPEVRS
jgi:glycosyltransferase involved in cell wall biosynthesis